MTQASVPKRVGSFDGKDVFETELVSKTGVRISVLNYGALIRDWQVPVPREATRHVVCGFDQFDDYPEHSPYFGAIVGRVANRIGGSKFTIESTEKEYILPQNDGPNHLHGGPKGLGKQVWGMEVLEEDESTGQVIRLKITSPDGEMGYPGNLTCSITYRLIDYRLQISMEAVSDAETPVNLAQHNYFNLMGDGCEIKDHRLWINAEDVLVSGKDLIPTGELQSVDGSIFDFTKPKPIKDIDGKPLSIDNSLVLCKSRNLNDHAAFLESPDQKLTLKLWTDQPSVHVYTAGGLNPKIPGLNGQHYPPFGAICLEDQNFPDAVNHPNFPCSILKPSETYRHVCEIEIGPGK